MKVFILISRKKSVTWTNFLLRKMLRIFRQLRIINHRNISRVNMGLFSLLKQRVLWVKPRDTMMQEIMVKVIIKFIVKAFIDQI